MSEMTSGELNAALSALDSRDDVPEKPVFYWGWYWRSVDWDAPSVMLACNPSAEPPSHRKTLEGMAGAPYRGGQVGFCENNKWGYPMFKVEGEAWDELKRRVRAVVENPTPESAQSLREHMSSLAPQWALETVLEEW